MPKLKVRAIDVGDIKWVGFYNLQRRKPGEEFVIDKEEDFSHNWMEPIGWTPKDISKERKESFKEVIRQKPSAIDVRKDMEKAKKLMKDRPTVDEPVPEKVVEVNVDDTSKNPADEAI